MAKSDGKPVALTEIPPVKIETAKIEAAKIEATTAEPPAALPPQAGADGAGAETDGAADYGEESRPSDKPRDRLVRVRNPAPACATCQRPGSVYRTSGAIQYVKCNGCGAQWKHVVTPEDADPLTALVIGWVRAARQAEPELHPASREMVFCVPKSAMEEFIRKAEEIVGRIETRKRAETLKTAVELDRRPEA